MNVTSLKRVFIIPWNPLFRLCLLVTNSNGVLQTKATFDTFYIFSILRLLLHLFWCLQHFHSPLLHDCTHWQVNYSFLARSCSIHVATLIKVLLLCQPKEKQLLAATEIAPYTIICHPTHWRDTGENSKPTDTVPLPQLQETWGGSSTEKNGLPME